MNNHNLTTALNIKIVSVVCLLMLMTTGYNHWLSVQEENDHNLQDLIAITDFLARKTPPNIFAMLEKETTPESRQAQIMAFNAKLQPILTDIYLPGSPIKFGFYAEKTHSIVALGPQLDNSLLLDLDPHQLHTVPASTTSRRVEEKHSILWYGASAITYSRPIEENGQVVGHIFASINQDTVAAGIWERTLHTVLGAFIMLLICIIIFRELFVKLKKDLFAFAEAILAGNADCYKSNVPEFAPILHYLSEQTKQMMRLDRLNIIGEMAAGIAHEIRNPMTTVRGLLQYIGNKPEFTPHKPNFTLMISELDCANSIITEFLSLSKNKSMEFKENNLNTIINEILPLLQADATYNNCKLQLDLQQIPNIMADKNSIRQFILNMVKNSMDAMDDKGTVTIHTAVSATCVNLAIEDDGMGIAPEIKEKLGTPFFTTKEKGTGLGLAICYRIAQRHLAKLTIDSTVNVGTTFTLHFNLPQPNEPQPPVS